LPLFDDLLVVMDKPDRAQVALARALDLQARHGGHVTLAAFVYHPMVDRAEAFETHQRRAVRRALTRERTEWLRRAVLDAGAAARNISLETVWTKDLAGWVSDVAAERRPSLVLKTVHRSHTLLHTPTDWDLLRNCRSPVLLMTGRAWRKRPAILATLDLGRTDRRRAALDAKVLDAAAEIAASCEGVMHAVHVIEIAETLRDLDVIDSRKALAQARVRCGRSCDRLLAPYGIPPSRIHLPAGKVGASIDGIAARTKADVLVLGTTARKGVRAWVMGSTAERILTHAPCDVLALKP
jgi:universal stress protein E